MAWLVFALRLLLGGVFLTAGALKVMHSTDLAAAIAGYRLLPASIVLPLAIALPPLELIFGFYLVAGLFTRIAAGIVCGMLLVYAGAIAWAVVRHLQVSCGCFGPGDNAVADWPHVIGDVLLACAALVVVRGAPGVLSVDRLFARMRTRESS